MPKHPKFKNDLFLENFTSIKYDLNHYNSYNYNILSDFATISASPPKLLQAK